VLIGWLISASNGKGHVPGQPFADFLPRATRFFFAALPDSIGTTSFCSAAMPGT
jgi:hypothetical protein